jgi:hypothetical protein
VRTEENGIRFIDRARKEFMVRGDEYTEEADKYNSQDQRRHMTNSVYDLRTNNSDCKSHRSRNNILISVNHGINFSRGTRILVNGWGRGKYKTLPLVLIGTWSIKQWKV